MQANNKANIATPFDTFITHFPDRSLPLVIRPCPGGEQFNNYTEFASIDSADGAPFHINAGFLAFGKIRTNGDYKALITLGMADCLGTELTTFDKAGKPIDAKYIGIGQCGSGPGFSCTEVVKIGADYFIYSADSITEQETDRNNVPIAGGKIYTYVIFRKGKLRPDGHIALSAEITDTIKMERDTSTIRRTRE